MQYSIVYITERSSESFKIWGKEETTSLISDVISWFYGPSSQSSESNINKSLRSLTKYRNDSSFFFTDADLRKRVSFEGVSGFNWFLFNEDFDDWTLHVFEPTLTLNDVRIHWGDSMMNESNQTTSWLSLSQVSKLIWIIDVFHIDICESELLGSKYKHEIRAFPAVDFIHGKVCKISYIWGIAL